MSETERRSCCRFVVEGATASFTTSGSLLERSIEQSDCEVLDLSRGGLRLLSSQPLAEDSPLHLSLHLPARATLGPLRGRVAWRLPRGNHVWQVAVEFTPYGSEPGDNLVAHLERLVALEREALGEEGLR